jgi:anti-sigma factor RsiW
MAMSRPLLSCRELIHFLADYLDGELAPDARAAFEAHLSVCPACVDYLAGYRETIRQERLACDPEAELPDEVPQELVDAILSARRC